MRLIGAEDLFQIVDFTHDDDDTNSRMSDIPLQLPASANASSSSNAALVTFSQADGDLMRKVHSLHPIPNQTSVNPWQSQNPQDIPSDPKRLFNWLHNEHEKALNFLREKARRALLQQQGEFLAATHQCEAAARQHLVSVLARQSEAHHDNVQVQVRQLAHDADARFSQRQRGL